MVDNTLIEPKDEEEHNMRAEMNKTPETKRLSEDLPDLKTAVTNIIGLQVCLLNPRASCLR